MEEPSRKDPYIYPAIVFEAMLGLGGILGGFFAGIPVMPGIHPEIEGVWQGVVATAPPVLLFFLLLVLPFAGLKEIGQRMRELILPAFGGLGILDLFLLSLLSGVSEEILFRGFIQNFVGQSTVPEAGILIGAVLFGLAHALSWTYAILAGFMGLYLGWLYQYTDNLMVPILVHSLYNFVAFLYYIKFSKATHDSSGE